MQSLQQMFRRNFESFPNLPTSMEEFWNMMTLYIDRLHALELYAIGELESIQAQHKRSDAALLNKPPSTMISSTELQSLNEPVEVLSAMMNVKGSRSLSKEEIMQHIQMTPPDELKNALLSLAKQLQKEKSQQTVLPNPEQDEKKEPPSLLPLEGPPREEFVASLKEWEIDLYEIQFLRRIGRGNAGTTYLATWRGQEVAVKVAAISDMGLDGWKTEVESLQRLHHPNIIRMMGSAYNESPLTYCLVLEYCNAGDLAAALSNRTPADFFTFVATSVANGLAYLHSRGVIHRDIKPANVLLQGNILRGSYCVKVSDFGVATHHKHQDEENRTAETGTYRWMAPEVVRHEPYSFKADVYSFAMLLWQLITHEDPFQDISQLEAAGKVALEKARPPLPKNTPKPVKNLIETCWADDPDERLSFDEILIQLADFKKNLKEDELQWINNVAPFGHRVYSKTPETAPKMAAKEPVLTRAQMRRAKSRVPSITQPKQQRGRFLFRKGTAQ